MNEKGKKYKEKVEQRLKALEPVFGRAAIGDFSENVELYEEEDEFTQTYLGVQIMLEVIRTQLSELTEINRVLEEKVTQLREEVAQRKVLEERKDEFIAILGHELRNPLSPILYAAELIRLKLQNSPQGEEVSSELSVIERQGKHMSRLIEDLLEISRLIRGTIELRCVNTDLETVTRSAIDAARPLIDARAHTLSFTPSPEQIIVLADPLRLEQIIVNILNNAAKYTPEGGVISVTLDANSSFGTVRVRDSGVGIAEENLKKIFDMFAEVGSSPAEHGGGLGVGLTIAKGLAHLHEGTVTVASEGLGKGSEFAVHIPLSTEPLQQTPLSFERKEGPASSRRILIIDDNKDHADTVGEMLQSKGHTVRISYDTRSGLALARSFMPEVVFLDIAMPGLDGYAAIRELRSDLTLERTRIIALTGFGQPQDFARTKAAGFDRHIVKPPALHALLDALHE